jgi:hypothetical protein
MTKFAFSTSVFLIPFLAMGAVSACTYYDPQVNYDGYKAWCTCIKGTIYNDGLTTIGCTPPAGMTSGSSSAPSSGYGLNFGDQMAVNSFNAASQEAGAALGSFMTNILSGNRQRQVQQETQRRAQEEAWNAEARRQQEALAAKKAQEQEEQHQRLLEGFKELAGDEYEPLSEEIPSESSQVNSGTDFFGIPGNPKETALQELSLKPLEEEKAAAADPSVLMNNAAYLASKGAATGNSQQAHELFEAAFKAATGQKIDFEIPLDIQGRPVSQEKLKKFQRVQKEYRVARERAYQAQKHLMEAKYEKQKADKVRQEAEIKVQEYKEGLPPIESEEEKAYLVKQAEANKLLQEATQSDDKATNDLQKAKEQANQAQQALQHAEDDTHDYVKTLAGPAKVNK